MKGGDSLDLLLQFGKSHIIYRAFRARIGKRIGNLYTIQAIYFLARPHLSVSIISATRLISATRPL